MANETNEARPPQGTYIDLDSMFDTRLALLYSMNRDIAQKCFMDKSYFKRKKDNFGPISYDIFMSLYRKRHKGLLQFAVPTNIISMLNEHYCSVYRDVKNYEDTTKPIVYLNTYPYELSITEQSNITLGLSKLIPNIHLLPICVSNAELTPEWVNENIRTMFKYDGLDWLEYHIATLDAIKKPMIDVLLISPALSNGVVPSIQITKDTFNNMMFAASSIITLMLVDASEFSAMIKK